MELIKLPLDIGLKIVDVLKTKGIEPRKNKLGLLSFEFTQEELNEITELIINNPTPNCLIGLENLKKLEKLKINSIYSAYKKSNPSISDKDIAVILKMTSLKSLTIANQEKISWLYLDNLTNLEELTIIRNNQLGEISGLDKLKKIRELSIYGNKELYELAHIQDLIISNDLDLLELDLLSYPEVCDLRSKLSSIINCSFKETLSHGGELSYNSGVASIFHKKSLEIIKNAVGLSRNNLDIIILIEKYLAQNISYDYDARDRENRAHFENGQKRGLNNGTQSAYNGLMLGTCVCEGYTRAMQYLLRILNMKTKNVYCIGGKDQIKINENYHNQVNLPNDGYHSIIRVEINNEVYYCDPCWDSCRWHRGDKTLPYCLKNKKDILKDHTLSFEEDNVSIDGSTISVNEEYIKGVCERNNTVLTPESNAHRR